MMSTMAQPPQQRPQFSPPPPNQQRDYALTNGRTQSFGAPSPQMPMTYSSPSPQQYSPQMNQAPPQKRQRLSPDAPSPFSNPQYPLGTSQAGSPAASTSLHVPAAQSSQRGRMGPPQRPAEKQEQDRSYDDILAGTGISVEEEANNLNRPDYYQTSGAASFGSYQTNSFNQSNGALGPSFGAEGPGTRLTEEQRVKREHERADWEAARHTQHALWDMFLYGGMLNEKIKKFSTSEHLVEAQAGVLVNTQRNAPPPIVRVNGLEGASRVIDRGQSILDTKDKAERLSEIMKLVSLAAKTRLTGLLNASARLALERREHSKGRIPDEWADIAVSPDQAEKTNTADQPAGEAGNSSLKRKRDDDTADKPLLPHPAINLFEKLATTSRTAEEARLAKRLKRKAKANEDKDAEATDAADAAIAAALDAEKKTTKKERKATESKFAEQQQHKNANEAARMATSSMIGRTFGKKGKSYSWMTGGSAAGGASAASTPGRTGAASSTGTPGPATPGAPRGPVIPRGRRFRSWDEENDKGVTVKDILLILEQDSLAAKSYIKGYSAIDGKDI